MPAVMAAGRAGGTVMVMMSRDSMIMVLAATWMRQRRSDERPRRENGKRWKGSQLEKERCLNAALKGRRLHQS